MTVATAERMSPAFEANGEVPAGTADLNTAGAPVVNLMRAHDLWMAVSDALIFSAPASAMVPPVQTVRLEATAEQLVAAATDRFVLGVSRVDYSGVPFTLTMSNTDALVLARMAKTLKRDQGWRSVAIDVETTDRETRLDFRFASGEAMTVRSTDTEFPRWRQLLPTDADRMGSVIGMGYNPANMAKFAKVANAGSRDRMVVFPTATERGPGPSVVRIGANFVGLIMPVRGPDSDESYSLPEWFAG